jgi:NADPH-dependent 2,4-dienoyl-CoA reductase/sulfur reductase-like enzyme
MLKGEAELAALQFHNRDHYAQANIELRLGNAARRLDPSTRSVVFDSGEQLSADRVIIATGARARPFPSDRCAERVHVLRELDDAVKLRERFRPGKRLAVIGGGFIGAEVASSASSLGLNVVVIEAATLPFERILGRQIARRLANLHAEAGVSLWCGVAVDRIDHASGGCQVIMLADGRRIEADIVVAGLGALPNVEWLAASGLELSNGVVCDAQGRTGVPGVVAAGDVASWLNPFTGLYERHEHWTSAREQARIVAQSIAGDVISDWRAFVPYFWSDLYGIRVQMLGSAQAADDIRIVHEDQEKRSFIAEYHRLGELTGVVGCNAGAKTMRYAPKLTRDTARAISVR